MIIELIARGSKQSREGRMLWDCFIVRQIDISIIFRVRKESVSPIYRQMTTIPLFLRYDSYGLSSTILSEAILAVDPFSPI
jgi:hypothetical protein